MSIYSRYLTHLEEKCVGCTGLRNQDKCRYAVVCAHVEHMKERGEIDNSKDLLNSRPDSDLLVLHALNAWTSSRSGIAATATSANSGIPEASRRGSYRDYDKEFKPG